MVATRTYSSFRVPGILWLTLILAAVLAVTLPHVKLNDHAIARHGSDAAEIRYCLQRSGPSMIWRKINSDRFFLVCKLDDGRTGVQLVQKIKGIWQEVTSFVPRSGAWEEVRAYLVQQATKWSGPLP